jgi:MFS family permease
MNIPSPERIEWQRGWKQLAAAMIASATGMPLYYAVASLFTLDILKDFHASRGEFANVQALLIVGALVAPVLGRTFDRFGFRRVYALGTVLLLVAHGLMALWVQSLASFAVVALIYGSAGLCSGPLGYTSLITAWFSKMRGMALGLAAIGVALMALVFSPLLAQVIAEHGWRAGYLALVMLGGLIGIPATLALARDVPQGRAHHKASATTADQSHFRDPSFWLMGFAHVAMAIPGAGLLSQLSPLIQDEGITPKAAAIGVAAYSAVPAIGLVMLCAMQLPMLAAIAAAAMVGIQQGAEIDLFAYFTARRFGLVRYGRVYGWIVAFGWIGNAIGILGFGWIFVASGSYAIPEAIGAVLLLIGAVLLASVKLPERGVSATD